VYLLSTFCLQKIALSFNLNDDDDDEEVEDDKVIAKPPKTEEDEDVCLPIPPSKRRNMGMF